MSEMIVEGLGWHVGEQGEGVQSKRKMTGGGV